MYRHISIFSLQDPSQQEELLKLLDQTAQCPLIAAHQHGTNLTHLPTDADGPDFGDVIQIIDFATKEDLQAYPASSEHMNLFLHGPKMKKVTAIDYEF